MPKINGAKNGDLTVKERCKKSNKGQFQKGNIGRKSQKENIKPIVTYLRLKLPDMPETLLDTLANILLMKKNPKLVLDAMKVVLGIEEIPDKNVVLPPHLQALLAAGPPHENKNKKGGK